MRNSHMGNSLKGLMVLGAMLVPGLTGAATTVYLVTSTANLVNQATFCGGPNDRYNGCNTGDVGFTWASSIPAGDTVNSISVELNSGVECHATATVKNTTLNAAAAGTWTVTNDCFCVPLQKLKTVTVSAAGIAAYVKNGNNTFLWTGNNTCTGNSLSATLGNAFARITIDHGASTGGACASPGQATAIEAKLDDGTRWTNDAERNAQTTTLVTPINRLETKLDDGTRFTSDTERNAQTTSILTPVAALEAKADDLAAATGTAERMAIESHLLNNPARLAILFLPAQCGGKLELVRSIVADSILKAEACNVGVGNAAADLAAGDTHYTAGRWKNAYDNFAQAYKTVTNGP